MRYILLVVLLMFGGHAFAFGDIVDNSNTNQQGQAQGQQQGQNQGQHQSNSNRNYNSDYNSNYNKSAAVQGQVSKVSNNVNVGGDDIDAEPAYAPNVNTAVSNLTCNSTAGGSIGGGGIFSIGASVVIEDEQCTARANTALVHAIYGTEIAKKYAEANIRGLADIVNPKSEGDEVASLDIKYGRDFDAVTKLNTADSGSVVFTQLR